MTQRESTVINIIILLKLWSCLPESHWAFSMTWYQSMKAVVEWDAGGSLVVPVFIGTTLKLFNISIDDLLLELQGCTYGLKIDGRNPNYFAYTYDITLLTYICASLTVFN